MKFPVSLCLIAVLSFPAVPAAEEVLSAVQLDQVLESAGSIQWQDTADWQVAAASEAQSATVSALRPVPGGNGSVRKLEGEMFGPGVLRGWVRASSEKGQDRLEVSIGGMKLAEFSGEETREFALPVPRGQHALGFKWTKDASRSAGADTVWLDRVRVEGNSEVPLTEALDLAGTPNAGRLTFSGVAGWRGITDAAARNGGDALFAPVGSGELTVTATQGSVVSFWTQSPANGLDFGYVSVKGQDGASVLTPEVQGPWKKWRAVLPAGAGLLISTPGGFSQPGEGHLLDDWTVEPLGTVSLDAALDTAVAFVSSVRSLQAATMPWGSFAPVSAGGGPLGQALTRDGADSIMSQPFMPEENAVQGGSAAELALTTTVTGPGRLSFWWRREGGGTDADAPQAAVFPPGQPDAATVLYLQGPVGYEWREVVVEVPPGSRTVQLRWTALMDSTLLLDQANWLATPRAVPPPSVADAADVTGLAVTNAGNWQPGGWTGAGTAGNDVLLWTPGPANQPLTATCSGPGWLTFSIRLMNGGVFRLTTDGNPEDLEPLIAFGGDLENKHRWQRICRWLPPGAHTVVISAPGAAGAEEVCLDELSFSATAPAWVGALEGTGLIGFQMADARSPVDSAVTHDDSDSLRLPDPGAGNSAIFEALAPDPGTLSWWWKQGDPDTLAVPPNMAQTFGAGVDQVISGNTDWQEGHIYVSTRKRHRWTWGRSSRPSLPGDALWLDAMTFTPIPEVTLGQALGSPELNWISQGPFSPVGAFPGLPDTARVDLARDSSVPPQPAWLETVLNGPGILQIKAAGIGYEFPGSVLIDGAPAALTRRGANAYFWELVLPGAGAKTCRVNFANQISSLEVNSITFTPLALTSPALALDMPGATSIQTQGSVAGISGPTAAHDGVDAVRLESTRQFLDEAWFQLALDVPAEITFWWRGEGTGSALTTDYTSSGDRASVAMEGTTPWKLERVILNSRRERVVQFIVKALGAGPYRVWVDQVTVTPHIEVPLAEALGVPADSITTGGAWRGLREPGGAAYVVPLSTQPPGVSEAWLEVRVTGPAVGRYTLRRPQSSPLTTSLSLSEVGGGVVGSFSPGEPFPIPAGDHLIRWAASGWNLYSNVEPPFDIMGFSAGVPDLPAALNTPGWTWTVTPQDPGTVWYTDVPRATDSVVLSDQNVLRTGGGAYLETTLTGPGWLLFEAALSPPAGNVHYTHALKLRLLPPVTPDPLPQPVYTKPWNAFNDVDPAAQAWIPAGAWRVRFEADGPAALNNVRFTPALDGAQIGAALELPAGLTAMTDPANPGNGGAVPAAVNHDGEDAITLIPGSSPGTYDQESITFAFNGPAVLSGWIHANDVTSMKARLNGKMVPVPLESTVSGWMPFRLPVTTSGPVTVELSVGNYFVSWPASRPVATLDEFTLTPLTPVSLTAALDAPGLTWTASRDSWTGWASALASPDATDAAWCLNSVDTAPAPPLWLETTLTGPGVLRFQSYGESGAAVQVSGGGRLPEQTKASSSMWVEQVYYIPPGLQTVRLSAVYGLTGLDNLSWEPGATTTLQTALEMPAAASVSTTGGDWIATTIGAFSHDGADAVMLRTPFTNPSTLEVPVAGPAFVSWWFRGDASITWSATLDDRLLHGYTGGGGGGIIIPARNVPAPAAPERASGEWYKEEVFVPAGNHTLRWTVEAISAPWMIPDPWLPASESAVLLGIDELTVAPLPASGISLAAAIDQPDWDVTATSLNNVMAVSVPAMSYDGTDAVLFNADSDDRPVLRTTVSGPGLLYYRWRSAGLSRGSFLVLLDGQEPSAADEWGYPDAAGWHDSWLLIPPGGSHEVFWLLNGAAGSESDSVLLDTVTFTPTIPLGTATGAPSLPWTTGGDLPWAGVPFLWNPTSMAFAPRLLPGQTSWIEATVTGPGRLKYQMEGAYTLMFDSLALHSSANGGRYSATLIVPAGSHQVRWVARFDEGLNSSNYLSSVQWTPSAAPDPVAEALDAPQLPWFFDGPGDPWQLQAAPALDGVDSLHWNQSGGSAWAISTVVPGPGTALIRAQATGGFTEMLMGKPYDGDWRVLTLPVQTGGPQVFTFQIYGNTGYSTGPNRVDIDRFEWTPAAVSLAESIDAPGPWTTSPDKPWTGVAVPAAHDGVDAVMAVNTAAGAWLETTVTGPVRVQFFARGTGGFLKVDGGSRIPGDNPDEWRPFIMELPAGSHTLHWESTGGEYTVDQFSATPLTIALAEALDHPGPWFVPDAGQWTVSTTDSSDGSDAALLSGQVGSNTLVLPVNGPGRLEFMARAPFAANDIGAEHPVLVTGGTTLLTAHFTGGWQSLSAAHIPPGARQLEFSLPGGYAGQPAAGFDQVRYTPYAEVPLAQALEGTGGVTFATSLYAPWKGYAAGTGACDGMDAVVVNGDDDSWLDITVPAGAGELSFFAMKAGNSADLSRDSIAFAVPTEWKRLSIAVESASPRTMRFTFPNGALWLDQVVFTPSAAGLQSWLAAHGLPANADLNSDTDRDGQPLLMEWAQGLDPLRNGARDPGVPPEAGAPVFELVKYPWSDFPVYHCRYARRTGIPGLRYGVEFSKSLDGGSFLYTGESTEELNNDWEMVTVSPYNPVQSFEPKMFGRLRVTWLP